jgi:hypothetical protein
MNNDWSYHELKAAEHAKRAELHHKKAAEYNDLGDIKKALYYAFLAASDMDYSTRHALQADDHCITTMINDMLEY